MKLNNRIVAFLMSVLMVWNSASAPLSSAYQGASLVGEPVVAKAQVATSEGSLAPGLYAGFGQAGAVSASDAKALYGSSKEAPEKEDATNAEALGSTKAQVLAADVNPGRMLEKTISLANGRAYLIRLTFAADAEVPEGAELAVKAYDDAPETALAQEELERRLELVKKGLKVEEGKDRLYASRLLNLEVVSDGKPVELSGTMKVEVETDDIDLADAAAVEVGLFDWAAKQSEKTVQLIAVKNKTENRSRADHESDAKHPLHVKYEFQTSRLGDFALVCAARAKFVLEEQGERFVIQGPGSLDVKTEDVQLDEGALPEGTELRSALAVRVQDAPAYGAHLWAETTAIKDVEQRAEGTGYVAYRIAGEAVGDQLFAAAGTGAPAAIEQDDTIAIGWDTGERPADEGERPADAGNRPADTGERPAEQRLVVEDPVDVTKDEAIEPLETMPSTRKLAQVNEPVALLAAQSDDEQGQTHTVVYDANGGSFANGASTNAVVYSRDSVEKYSHTPNVSDEGAQGGVYAHSYAQNEVVTIDGASKLEITIVYGGESANYDWVCAWDGSHPEYTASSNHGTSFTGKLGGGSHTAASNTKTYTRDGDTVTFAFRTDGSGVGDGYGYYAVVKGLKDDGSYVSTNVVHEGAYATPKNGDRSFEGWYLDQECTQPFNPYWDVPSEDGATVYANYVSAGNPVARVCRNHSQNWTYFGSLDEAIAHVNTLSGGVDVELLKDSYTVATGFTLSGSISSLSLRAADEVYGKCTLLKGQNDAALFTVSGNVASLSVDGLNFNGGGEAMQTAANGGIFSVQSNYATFKNCSFKDCYVKDDQSKTPSDNGANARSNGAAIACFNAASVAGELRIEHCSFENCEANSYNGGDVGNQALGGAVFFRRISGGSALLVDHTSFKGCTSNRHGGAVFVQGASGSVEIRDSSFDTCTAKIGGGGAVYSEVTQALTITNSDFATCKAKKRGGAVYAAGTVNIKATENEDVSFSSCATGNGAAANASGDTADGGAIYTAGALSMNDNAGTIAFVGCQTTGSNNEGGALYAAGNVTAERNAGVIRFADCVTTGNSSEGAAVFSTGAITMTCAGEGALSFEGCLANASDGGGAINGWSNKGITITGTEAHPVSFVNCQADKCNGGRGGGALFSNGGAINLKYCNISGCTANKGAAVYATGALTLDDCNVTGNNATTEGTIQVAGSGTVHFKGSTKVYGNTVNGADGHNVYLNLDDVGRLYADGLSEASEIRVFVTDGIKGKRGYAGRMFGAYTNEANLDHFINERFSDSSGQPLRGTASTTYEGYQRIAWQGEDITLTLVSSSDDAKPIQGARFELSRSEWDSNAVIWRGTTDEKGQVRIPWTGYEDRDRVSGNGDGGAANFINGRQYELRQLQSSEGFALPGGRWVITVNAANGLTSEPKQLAKANRIHPLEISGTNLERNAWRTKNDPDTIKVNYDLNAQDASVDFIGEDGASLPNPQTVSFTKDAYVARNATYDQTPTREGFHFVGWNTKANGSGTAYAAGATLYYSGDVANGEMTLYAQWEEAGHVARISRDGGKNWTYYDALVSGTYDGESVTGAFDAANTGSGDVIIETLYAEHERYALASCFTFTRQANFTIRANPKLSGKSKIVKAQEKDPVIIFNARYRTLALQDLVFDGQNNPTTSGRGGIIRRGSNNPYGLTITDCDFINACVNGDSGQGGAIAWEQSITINHTTSDVMRFENCHSSKAGGAVYTSGSYTLAINNTGDGDVVFDDCTSGTAGGALYVADNSSATARISNACAGTISFTNCKATSGAGGAIACGMLKFDYNRGAIDFRDCEATTTGGAVNCSSDSSGTYSTVDGNGGTIAFSACHAGGNGGAIAFQRLFRALDNAGEISFENCTSGGSGGAVAGSHSSSTRKLELRNSGDGSLSFANCTAATNGGALYTNNFEVVVAGASSGGAPAFTTCKATAGSGGAIYGGGTNLTNVTFGVEGEPSKACTASANGGAVYCAGAGTLNDVEVYRSTATNGGAVYFNSGANHMTDCTVTDCSATTNGGAVHLAVASSLTFSGGRYTGNTASGSVGGAVSATSDSSSTHLYFQGDVYLYDNLAADGSQKNVVLSIPNRNGVINTTSQGLGADAKVGIYVTGNASTNPYRDHGQVEQVFGTHSGSSSSVANLNKFISDRNPKLKGDAGSGRNVVWGGDYVCKLTDAGDNLLYKSEYGAPAIYGKISSGMVAAGGTLYYKDGDSIKPFDGVSPVKLKLLADVELTDQDVPTYTGSRELTMTTAELPQDNTDGFAYVRGEENPYASLRKDGWASIKRARTGSALITLNTAAGVAVENLLFDGDDKAFTGNGGCFSVTRVNHLNFKDVVIENFKCAEGGAVYGSVALTVGVPAGGTLRILDCTASREGGAFRLNSRALTINNEGTIEVRNCTASTAGGAVSTNSASPMTIRNTGAITFESCAKPGSNYGGGAIYTGAFTVTNSGAVRFVDCTTGGYGGAVACCGNTIIENATFNDCVASGNGGAIYVGGSYVYDSTVTTITGCEIDGHVGLPSETPNSGASANYGGGGIYVDNGDASMTGTTIKNCTSAKKGGAAFFNMGAYDRLTVDGCEIDGHDSLASSVANATDGGGLALNVNDHIAIENTRILDCTASGSGGGIHTVSNAILQNGVQISGCGTTATSGKGAALFLATSGKSVHVNGGTVAGANGVKVTGCSAAAPQGGALECVDGAKFYFEGNAYIHDNPTSASGQRNVVLAYDNRSTINTTTNGLGEDAAIGVYVTDAYLSKRGEKYTDFGTFATNTDNLDAFMNDRRALVGGEKDKDTIAWSSAYNLLLDPNGGEGTTISVMLTYFKEYTLGAPFTKDGYHFAGWNTRKDGTGDSYAASDVVSELTDEDGGTVTLYAQWEDYTACGIYFHPNGGTEVPSREVKPGTTLGLLPSSTREHYTFVRWMLMKDGVEESYSQNTVVNEDMHFYALWEKKVAITFDAQGGIVGESVREMAPGKIGTLPKTEQPAAAKHDYEFVRWYALDQDGNRSTVTANTEFTKDDTVYAEWKVIPRRLRYNTNGGYPGRNYATNDYWYDSEELTDLERIKNYTVQNLPSVTNRGYELDGWFVGSTRISNGDAPIEGVTIDLRTQNVATAHWTKLDWVTVSFNSDGGSACNAISVYKGDKVDHYPEPTKKGYAFKGWYLLDEANLFAKDAEGNDIEVNVLTPINEDITVKAKWESYVTVTFDSDGGSTCSPISVEKGTRIKDFPKPTKDGYVFAGWFTDAGVEVDESTVISEDMTVKAKWNELVTVTFNWTDRTDASGSPVVTTETVEKGKSLLKIPGTYREGYVLEGWYPDEQFAGEPLTASTVISEDTTYYAKWRLSAVTKESPIEYEYNIIWTDASTSELTNLDDCLSWYVSGSPSRTIEAHAYVGFALKETEGKVFPEGSVKVRVPKYVFEDWNGRRITGTNNIVEFIPKAPAKSKSLEWNYVDEGDYYLLQNTRASENVTLDLKITYAADLRDVKAARIDSETGKHLDAHGNVLEHDDYAPRANTFTVMIQSDGGTVEESKVLSTAAYKTYTQTTYTADFTKGSASARRTWNDAWGEKPADADDYYYVTWVHGGFTVRAHGDFAGSTAGLFETTSKEWVDDAYDVVYTDPAGNYVVTRHPYAELTGSRKTLYKKEVARGSWTASGVEETGRGTIPCEIDYRVYEPYTPTPTSESVTGLGASKSFGYWYYKGFRTGQDALLDDETLSTSAYTLSMSGPGADHLVQKGDTNLYYADEYTMVMRDGAPGDISCYSERSGRRVRLGDNDYDFTRLSISLSNSDGYRDDSGWHSLANTAYSSWRPVEVWLRKTGETEFYKYTDVYITSGSSKAVVLPSDTAGFEVRHSTFYWRTHLSVSPTIVINPTTHVKNVVQPDYLARVATRFYNKASYQAVSNDTGEVRWSGTREDDFYIGKSKTGLRVSKSVDSSKVVLDNENSVQTVPVTVTGYHYNDSGRVKPIHSGVFYELLPLDTIVDESSVYVEAGSTRLSRGMVNVEYAADWQGSGQTMMIVSVGMPETIRSSSVELHYTLTNTYENIIARGTNLYTPSAFANTSTVKEYYEVLPKVKRINEIKDGQKYFSEQEKAYGEYVAYGSADVKFRDINVSSSSFSKAVNTLNAYAEDAEVIAQTPYTYRLVYGQSDYAKSDSVVLYDLLDQGSVSDEYSNLYGVASAWQGTFGDVRVPEVTSDGQKCKPVVYYSTTDEKDINNLSKDLTDTAVWSTTRPSERITAIAIDFSKDEHGNDFVLTGKDSIVAYVTMTSPADETLNGKTAVNTAISTSRISAVGAAVEERHLEAQTTVMMKPVVPTITLTSTPASGTKDAPRLMAYKDTLTYDIAIHNPDTEFAYRNISLEDLLPEGVTPERGNIYVYTESDPSTRVKIGGSTRVSQSLEGDLSKRLAFEVGELLPGETLHIAIPCVVDTKEGRLENQATLTEVNGLVKELKSEKTYHEVRQYDVLYGKKKLGVDPEEFLAGASLQLLDASGNKVDGWKSTDASGTERHTVRIGAGEYTLEETEAPKDYAIADPIRFTLSREGLVTLRGETDPLEDRVVDMYDKYIAVDVVVENHTLGDDADPQKEFAYTATMTGLKPGETYAAGSQSFTADRAGNATYEFKLKGDENMTLSKLPTGASVVVTQVGTDYSTSYVAKATKDGAETVLHSGETNLKGQDLVTQSTDVDVDQGVVHFSFQNVLNQNVTPVRFVVYDETGETPLAGSSFKLLGPEPAEGETQYVYEWVSKEDHKRVDVPQGHEYALTQTSAADGYLPMEGDFALVVDEDGTVTSKGEGAELTQDENGYVVVIRNVRQAHVKVQNKSTATDYFLAGAELELLEGTDLETAQRVGEPWKSEAEAARDLYLKADKTYFIRKTSSPANHLAVDPVVVKVTVDAQRKVVVEPASNYDDKTETVTLYDRPVETLAITSKVTGADPDKPFEYTISDLKEGETYSYAITDNAGKTTEGTMTVDADGKAHFGLRHDETIVIRDLPHSITISETKPEGHYYNTEWIQDETNVLKPEDTIASSTVPVSLNGRNSIVVTNKECVARVRNKTTDGAWSDWTYFEYLTSDAGDGAFDFANGLTGDVEIETLWESHDRYEMSQGFEFTNQGITSLTIQSTETLTKAGKHTTITGNSASSLLVFNTEGPVEVKNLEFDGKEHAQTSDGGAMSVGSGSLVLTDVEIHDFTTLGNGGAVYVGNDATLTMEDGTAIKDCSATHGGAVYAAHENGQKGSFVMNGGTITGNTTTQDGHAAVEAATMQFNGTVKVIGNTNRISDSAANVLLYVNSNEVIRSLRLEEDSEIGVYVNDEQLEAHGGSGDPFGTYTVDQNLDKFTNDRKPDLYAEAADDPSSKRIIWHATESNLTIAHTVSGDYADVTRKFEITVTSEQLVGQTVQLEGSDMPLTFDENGVAIISLANGESVTLLGLPDATVVSVVSEGTPYKTSYTVTQGDVTSDDPTHITMKSGMDARVDIASVLDVVPATGIGEDAAAWGSLVAISAVCFFFLWEHRRRRA